MQNNSGVNPTSEVGKRPLYHYKMGLVGYFHESEAQSLMKEIGGVFNWDTPPIFYHEELQTKLIDKVIEQIKKDLNDHDVESLWELLTYCPANSLISYLPEEDHSQFQELR